MATATKRTNEKPITIGTCTSYLMEFDGTSIPEIDDICKPANRLAYTKSGANIKYESESNEVTDDLGLIKKNILASEKVTVSLGVLGWVGTTLAKLIPTSRVSSNEDGTRRSVKIGGLKNDNGKRYVICLHHQDSTDGDCWWMLVGKNTDGFELQYTMEDGVPLTPTFTAEPMDDDGTLLIYTEETVKVAG